MESPSLTLDEARELKKTLKTIPTFIADELKKRETDGASKLSLEELFQHIVFARKTFNSFPRFRFTARGPPVAILQELTQHGYIVDRAGSDDADYAISLTSCSDAKKYTKTPMLPMHSEMVSARDMAMMIQTQTAGDLNSSNDRSKRLQELCDEIKTLIEKRFNSSPAFIFTYIAHTVLVFDIQPVLKWLITCVSGTDFRAMIRNIVIARGLCVQEVSVGDDADDNFCCVHVNNEFDESYTYPDFKGNRLVRSAWDQLIICITVIDIYIKRQPSIATISVSSIKKALKRGIKVIKETGNLAMPASWYFLIMGMHGYWTCPIQWGSLYHRAYVPMKTLINPPASILVTHPTVDLGIASTIVPDPVVVHEPPSGPRSDDEVQHLVNQLKRVHVLKNAATPAKRTRRDIS
jgi:hypothetical protein